MRVLSLLAVAYEMLYLLLFLYLISCAPVFKLTMLRAFYCCFLFIVSTKIMHLNEAVCYSEIERGDGQADLLATVTKS